ncbi:MAG: iron-containing alcohol dehydrogenase family protein [Planctomycetota bacterium]
MLDFSIPTRIVFGPDSVDRVGSLAGELGALRVFLVTDPGIVGAGHVERVERALIRSKLQVRRFDRVRENPTTRDVEACLEALGDWDPELLVGLGGGSSIDVAKGMNFLRASGGEMKDYQGFGKARGSLLPLIAIPTTAGTGSEMQSFALIAEEDTHQKMACGDPRAAARTAILDPTLTATQPRFVTACTGLDTLGHAVETAVTRKRSAVSRLFSTEAFVLAEANLPRVLEDPADLDARGRMQLAAAYGGIAIENSMLGAAHSMANPLTAHYDIAHGQAVAMMLPGVVRYNAEEPSVAALYAELARRARLSAGSSPDAEAVDNLLARITELLETAGIDACLPACGVPQTALESLAAEASRQWTAAFNPREVSEADFQGLFEAAFRQP